MSASKRLRVELTRDDALRIAPMIRKQISECKHSNCSECRSLRRLLERLDFTFVISGTMKDAGE